MKNLRFKEVLEGRLAPQSFDASQGYRDIGAIAAYLHADIDIRDLDVFIDYPDNHRGRMRASLVIPVLGEQPFTADDGVFELFRPDINPDDGGVARLMVYDAVLLGNERVYAMRARKYLKPKSLWPLHLWKETTSLEVELRDVTGCGQVDISPEPYDVVGDGSSFEELPAALRNIIGGEAIPAWLTRLRNQVREDEVDAYRRDFGRPAHLSGVLHLSFGGLIRLVTTLHAAGVPRYRRPFAVARFLMFFVGSLGRIYLLRDRSQAPT
jgi:hypothetical protein